jgi:peptidoglycan hydrolase CwlO-like protein
MALTELEQTLINTLQRSQQQQTETISSLRQQIKSLSAQVQELTDAYNKLARVYYNGPESSE